ncbi:MAG: DUF6489 family protein [Rhodospirillales bacterium]
MKVTIDVDCSPDEARRFLGLPDVSGLNEALVAALQAKMAEGLAAATPETLMKAWFPAAVPGVEQWQTFWSQVMGTGQEKGKS